MHLAKALLSNFGMVGCWHENIYITIKAGFNI